MDVIFILLLTALVFALMIFATAWWVHSEKGRSWVDSAVLATLAVLLGGPIGILIVVLWPAVKRPSAPPPDLDVDDVMKHLAEGDQPLPPP
jgi:hypothetical protein